MNLIRGGKFVKVETHTLAGDVNFSWIENYNFHPLTADQKNFDDRDNADFLEEEGQLKYDLACQLDNFTEFAVNQNDQVNSLIFGIFLFIFLDHSFHKKWHCSSSRII